MMLTQLADVARKAGLKVEKLPARFWLKVALDDSECWTWTAALNNKGYGHFSNGVMHRPELAHRVAYEALIGPVAPGLELDHLCRHPKCVNPHHLEPVTHRINVLRGMSPTAVNATKTECPVGHPFTQANTQTYDGKRKCKACHAARERARRARIRRAKVCI